MSRNRQEYPRVLIISNECLSQSGSNGRTLRNFLTGWPMEYLAQFSLQSKNPDFTVCQRFFCTTDAQTLSAFLGRGCGGGVVTQRESEETGTQLRQKKKTSRTALTMLLRELVWNSRRWTKNGFWQWVDDFGPQLVLLQAGDCGFMFRLAQDIAREYQIPLVIYNSEAYYFKSFDYFRARGLAHWCYPLFRWQFCRQFKKTMSQADSSVYICKPLQVDYDKEFSLSSETVYTATTICPKQKGKENGTFTSSYLGNLGVGRHEPLVEIANALQSISPEFFLDVYGKIPNETVQAAFDSCPGIRCKGFVSYERVVEIMHNSDLLVHGENFSGFYREDLKYAFSTKIADSLASGTCFLVYAPEEMASTRYLTENEAAYVVSDQNTLKETLRMLAEQPDERLRYIKNALAVVERNHRAEHCAKTFQEILRKAVTDK